MKLDIILSGVGGQGILSIATVIGEAATAEGVNLKQAEVHGMSQRGGDVQSNLRLSREEIFSDLIPKGKADLIIAMEPMEALRYVPYLSAEGWIVTSSKPFVNIPDYPREQALLDELSSYRHCVKCDIEALAAQNKMPRSANMILLGMAAPFIPILKADSLKAAVSRIFSPKGEQVAADNEAAFELGFSLSSKVAK